MVAAPRHQQLVESFRTVVLKSNFESLSNVDEEPTTVNQNDDITHIQVHVLLLLPEEIPIKKATAKKTFLHQKGRVKIGVNEVEQHRVHRGHDERVMMVRTERNSIDMHYGPLGVWNICFMVAGGPSEMVSCLNNFLGYDAGNLGSGDL